MLNVAVAVFFALGYLAFFGYPGRLWWVELVAVGLPFLGAVAGILLVINIVLRRPTLVVVHVAIVVLAIIRIAPWERLVDSGSPGEGDLTLMTFNVPRWWGYLMEAKTAEMASFMRETDPDVAALQEATLAVVEGEPRVLAPPYVRVLMDSLGYRAAGEDDMSTPFHTPQPVFGRVEFLSKSQREIVHPEDRDIGGTNVVRAVFRWQGRDVVIYNIHLRTYGRDKPWAEEEHRVISPSFWIRYLNQYRQAYRVRNWEVDRILEMIEREEIPVIIVGDLNSTPNNSVYRRLAEGRQDVFRVAGSGWGMTYHTRLPMVRIDYILVGPEWEVADAFVPRVWLSDHLPVVASIRWAESGSNSEDAQ